MIRQSIVAVGSVVALALTASVAPAYAAPAPGPAPAAAIYATKVTANAKPDPIAKKKTITVTGTLKIKKNGQWRPLAGKWVTVHFDPAGADKSRKVATVKTTATGKYTRKFTANRSGKWTVRYAGTSLNKRSSAADTTCVYTAGRWQCPVSPSNPDLDCKDIGRTVWVGKNDYHDLDRDNDGWGCDSYS